MRRFLAFVLASPLVPVFAGGQAPHRTAIRAGRLIDGKSDKPIENALILIEGDKIASATPGGGAPAGAEVIDLSKTTVLPGFIDVDRKSTRLNSSHSSISYAVFCLKKKKTKKK